VAILELKKWGGHCGAKEKVGGSTTKTGGAKQKSGGPWTPRAPLRIATAEESESQKILLTPTPGRPFAHQLRLLNR